jgi:hypothetical protein
VPVKASVVTFAQLPEEEAGFLAYLAKAGDVWARAVVDNPRRPAFAPAPVAEFLEAHAAQLAANGVVDVYLGFRPEVLKPAVSETAEGVLHIDIFASNLIGYQRGKYYPGGELAQSNLYFYRGSFCDGEFASKPEAFLRWAAKVLGWARRHAPERVLVYRCNYLTRATARVAEAAAGGLKVWY